MADERDPLPYAAPEQQKPPRFQTAWGGWVLVALMLIAAARPIARMLARWINAL